MHVYGVGIPGPYDCMLVKGLRSSDCEHWLIKFGWVTSCVLGYEIDAETAIQPLTMLTGLKLLPGV